MFNFESSFTIPRIEIEHTDSNDSLFEEITVKYGTRKDASLISLEYSGRDPNGQQYAKVRVDRDTSGVLRISRAFRPRRQYALGRPAPPPAHKH